VLQKIKLSGLLLITLTFVVLSLVACGGDDPPPPEPEIPLLSVTPTTLNFDSTSVSETFAISNTGDGDMSWSCTNSTAAWLTSMSPTSGTVTNNTATVTVTVDRTGLGVGDYSASIYVASAGGSDTIDVTMNVAAIPVTPPELHVEPDALDFDSASTQLSVEISNSGGETLNWTMTKASGCDWLTFTPAGGSAISDTDIVTVTVDRTGLDPNSYSCELFVASNGGADTVTIDMTVVPDPSLCVVPDTLDFGATETAMIVQVTNCGTGTLNWLASKDGSDTWIGISPGSGDVTSDTDQVSVSVDRSGLSAGPYSAEITISEIGGDAESVTVTILMEVQSSDTVVVALPDLQTDECDSVETPLTVENFTAVGGLEFHIAYDTLQVTFDSVSSAYLSGMIASASNGIVNIIWADMTGSNPVTVADGEDLLVIHFSDLTGTSALTCTGNNELTDSAGTTRPIDPTNGSMECTAK